MKRCTLIALLAVMVGVGPVAWAEQGEQYCAPGMVLKTVGTVLTASGVISAKGVDVRAFWMVPNGTLSGDIGWYDGTNTGDASTANLRFETAADNTGGTHLIPSSGFFPQPVYFKTGVVAIFTTSGVQSAGVLACSTP